MSPELLDNDEWSDEEPRTPSQRFAERKSPPPPPEPKKIRGPFRKIVLWEKHRAASGKAILFSTGDASSEDAEDMWLPVSQINHIQREPAKEGGLARCTIEATEWILTQKGL